MPMMIALASAMRRKDGPVLSASISACQAGILCDIVRFLSSI
jgi:hypothetical protein